MRNISDSWTWRPTYTDEQNKRDLQGKLRSEFVRVFSTDPRSVEISFSGYRGPEDERTIAKMQYVVIEWDNGPSKEEVCNLLKPIIEKAPGIIDEPKIHLERNTEWTLLVKKIGDEIVENSTSEWYDRNGIEYNKNNEAELLFTDEEIRSAYGGWTCYEGGGDTRSELREEYRDSWKAVKKIALEIVKKYASVEVTDTTLHDKDLWSISLKQKIK